MRFSHCPSQHLPEKPTFAVGAFGSRYGKAVELEWAVPTVTRTNRSRWQAPRSTSADPCVVTFLSRASQTLARGDAFADVWRDCAVLGLISTRGRSLGR